MWYSILIQCSCLIARNLLSGLKTCMEIASYMHAGGVLMPYGSFAASSSIMDDKGKFDAECQVRIISFHFPSSLLCIPLSSLFVLIFCSLFFSFCIFFWGGGRLALCWRWKIKFSIYDVPKSPAGVISLGCFNLPKRLWLNFLFRKNYISNLIISEISWLHRKISILIISLGIKLKYIYIYYYRKWSQSRDVIDNLLVKTGTSTEKKA